jgi:DNA polymerase III subunit gamma/tau
MTYKVIARKYRPQIFGEVVGQQHVTQTLANAIRSNRVAHAYIFSGVRGVGKTTTARILAKALNCAKGPTPEPDNTCDSCREIAAGTSLDVLEIDAASNRGIEQIRELREMVRYAPASSRYKVVILDEAHQLTDEASNALLKTLEEPPERVVFILATTRSEDLVETIKSRAQLFQFRSLTYPEIAGEIERIAKAEKLKIDSGAVSVLARAAEGSLRDGLSLFEQAIAYCGDASTDAQVRELLGVVAESVLDELITAITAQSAERTLALVHRLISEGQNLQHFCREAIRHIRNLLVTRVCGAASDLITAPPDERPRLAAQASQFSEEDLTRFFQILLYTDEDMRRKPDTRLHLELGLLKLVNAQRLAPLEEILSDLNGESKPAKTGSGSGGSKAAISVTRSFSAFGGGVATAVRMAPDPTAAAESIALLPSTQSAAVEPVPAAPLESRVRAKFGLEPSDPANRFARPTNEPAKMIANAMREAIQEVAGDRVAALKKVLQEQKLLWSMLQHASRWELKDSELQIFFPPESKSLAEMLQAREAMERLRTALAQLEGQPLRVCVKLDSNRASVDRSRELLARFEQDSTVRAMLERFGGQISRVKSPGEG